MFGWEDRANPDLPWKPKGIMLHHDGMGLHNENVPMNMSRPGEYGAQIWGKYDGLIIIIAAGYMQHAGDGIGYGQIPANEGNRDTVGFETDYIGTGPWPPKLLASLRLTLPILAKVMNISTDMVDSLVCGHKEYAPNRKWDPGNLDMNAIRTQLKQDLNNEQDDTVTPQDIETIIAGVTANLKESPITNPKTGVTQDLETRITTANRQSRQAVELATEIAKHTGVSDATIKKILAK